MLAHTLDACLCPDDFPEFFCSKISLCRMVHSVESFNCSVGCIVGHQGRSLFEASNFQCIDWPGGAQLSRLLTKCSQLIVPRLLLDMP